MPVRCKWCNSVDHTQFYCKQKPRTPIKPTRLKPTGKHHARWATARAEWFRNHPADSYDCYICGRHLGIQETQLDHIKSRVRYPQLRYVQSNLAPICSPCNREKGSKDLEELRVYGRTD